jgi:hypothetical protein
MLYAALNAAPKPPETDTIVLQALTPDLITNQLKQRAAQGTLNDRPGSLTKPVDDVETGKKPLPVTESLVRQYINEELLLRKAYALQLHEDGMIRERLINKAKFALEGQFVAPTVTDAELTQFFNAHKSRYKAADTITFEHALIAPEHYQTAAQLIRDNNANTITRTQLRALQKRAFISSHFENANQNSITSLFGELFLKQLLALPENTWSGLLESKHGKHLVRRSATVLKPARSFEEVRETVYKDWVDTQRAAWLVTELERLREAQGIDLEEYLINARR